MEFLKAKCVSPVCLHPWPVLRAGSIYKAIDPGLPLPLYSNSKPQLDTYVPRKEKEDREKIQPELGSRKHKERGYNFRGQLQRIEWLLFSWKGKHVRFLLICSQSA